MRGYNLPWSYWNLKQLKWFGTQRFLMLLSNAALLNSFDNVVANATLEFIQIQSFLFWICICSSLADHSAFLYYSRQQKFGNYNPITLAENSIFNYEIITVGPVRLQSWLTSRLELGLPQKVMSINLHNIGSALVVWRIWVNFVAKNCPKSICQCLWLSLLNCLGAYLRELYPFLVDTIRNDHVALLLSL